MNIRQARRGRLSAAAAAVLLVASAGQARAQGKLEFKYPDDNALEYKSTSNVFQVLNLMGMEIQSSEKRTMVWSLTGGKRRADGSLPVAFKIFSLKSEMKLQGGIELAFDSTRPDSFSGDQNFAALGEVYKLQSELAYTLVLDEHGTPKSVEELDSTRDKAGKLDPISQEMVRGQVDPARIKSQFEQEHHFLPDHPVRPGEAWERNEILDSQGGLLLTVRKKYEYAGSEKKGDQTLDKINCKTVDIKHDPDPSSRLPLKVIRATSRSNRPTAQFCLIAKRGAWSSLEIKPRSKAISRSPAAAWISPANLP